MSVRIDREYVKPVPQPVGAPDHVFVTTMAGVGVSEPTGAELVVRRHTGRRDRVVLEGIVEGYHAISAEDARALGEALIEMADSP